MKPVVPPLSSDDPRSRDPGLEELVAFAGYRPNALLTMAIKPGLLAAILQLVGVTIRGEGSLPDQLRFLLACEASRGAGCHYSATHAVHAAFHLGVPWEKLAALDDFERSDHFTAKEKAALGMASAAATLPVSPAEGAVDRAKQFFSEGELLEIASIIALFGWFNRWNSLMRSELEDVPSEAVEHVHWLKTLGAEAKSRLPVVSRYR